MLWMLASQRAEAQVTFERLMTVGDLTPEGPPFQNFQPPVVNSAGAVLVLGQADHGGGLEQRAYVREPDGTVRLVLQPNTPIPQSVLNIMTPSVISGGLLDRSGSVLFSFASGFTVAILVSPSGTTILGEHNQPCPASIDASRSWSSVSGFSLSDTGRALLTDAFCTRSGLARFESGSYTWIAGMSSPVPGVGGTPTFANVVVGQALQSDAGHLWYVGNVSCPDDPRCLAGNAIGLFLANPQGSSSLIYLYGQAAPGVSDNSLLGPTRVLSVNAAGVALAAITLLDQTTRQPVGSALYSVTPAAALTMIARVGDPAPGLPGATISALADPDFALDAYLGDEGTIAFRAQLAGSGINSSNNVAIFRMTPTGALGLAAQHGATAPDGGIYDVFTQFLLSPGGRLALRARTILQGSVNEWLFLENDNGVLVPALGSGTVDLGLGVPASVSNFTVLGVRTTGTDGRGRVFDGNGAIIAWVDHDGTQSIFSIRAGDPPRTVDLVAIEATQVVQDLRNSVQLIQGKPTFLRAYLEADEATRVRVRLRGRRNGAELPGSPYEGRVLGAISLARPNILSFRDTLAGAPYFEIPPAWTSGTIEVEVELHPDAGDVRLACQEAAGPNPNDCKATLTFEAPPPALELQLFRFVHWRNFMSDAVPRVDGRRLIDELRTFYPITKVRYKHRDFSITSQSTDVVEGDYFNSLLRVAKEKDQCTEETGCRAIYYGYYASGLTRNFGGLADPSGGVAVGNAIFDGWYHYTQLHEIGHVLGRPHAVTTRQVTREGRRLQEGECQEYAALGTPPWPYFETLDGRPLATLSPLSDPEGIMYGFNPKSWSVVDPRMHFELMSYCDKMRSSLDPFISGFTYGEIAQAIQARFPSSPPIRTRNDYSYVSAVGTLFADGAELTRLRSVTSARSSIPAPPPGDYALEVRDRAGALLQSISFAPTESEARPGLTDDGLPVASFQLFIPTDPPPATLVLLKEGVELTRLAASANAPTVSVTAPNGGENLSGDSIEVRWTGADADGDLLSYDVSLSTNGGASWTAVVADWLDESITLPATAIAGSTTALIRVEVSDGFNVGSDQSDAVFTTANRAPAPEIIRPSPGSLYFAGDAIILAGEAIDEEDVEITGAALEWSSNLDGILGSGEGLMVLASSLSEGDHQLTLRATDSSGTSGTETISLRVRRSPPAVLGDLRVTGSANPNPVAPAGTASLTFQISNDGPDEAPATSITLRLPPGVTFRSATGPSGPCVSTGSEQQCPLGAIPAFSQVTANLELTAETAGLRSIEALLPLRDSDPNPANDQVALALLIDESGVSAPVDGGVLADATVGDGAAPSDAGVDAGSTPDSGANNTPPPNVEDGGCGCTTSSSTEVGLSVLLFGAYALLRRSGRRRRSGR